MNDTPVVLIVGARQVGKTTLAKQLVADDVRFRTLDVAATREAARSDPDGFVSGGGTVVIDEVQRVPELLLAIKAAVDRDRRPGAFILTGSADVMAIPAVADSLAGRIEIHALRPLAVAELAGERRSFLDVLHDGDPSGGTTARSHLIDMLLRGGFPDARARSARRRDAWFADYVETVIQREVTAIADIQYADQLPRLLRLLAHSAPGMLNISGISSDLGMPRSTVDRYLAILRQVFLVQLLPAWHANIGSRQVKSPRTLLCDPGLQAHLLGLDEQSFDERHPERLGSLLETMVGCELLAHQGWSSGDYDVLWWRTGRGTEVDFVIERRGGTVMGIEVKASSTVRATDVRGLRQLRDATGERFRRGVILYGGSDVLSFGDRLEAWPLAAMWGGQPLTH
jgi:predicted AAA+ superfamily ATPase